jgi:hypothetical protein
VNDLWSVKTVKIAFFALSICHNSAAFSIFIRVFFPYLCNEALIALTKQQVPAHAAQRDKLFVICAAETSADDTRLIWQI